MSLSNLIPLAEEVFLYKKEAQKHLNDDIEARKKWISSMGESSRMGVAAADAKSDNITDGEVTPANSDTNSTQDSSNSNSTHIDEI